ncbi:hypothetical protein SORBI_3007G058700 [Sorghum bicolor]|uniref:Uncharacterized protein n=1 Tax=Sorghum bicolor TaxID=4558 RepID=A0A1B6PG02_SORBI|nr:hypothetical protein SORBI_3007G058700 [Sorghum bicolor]
MLNAAKVIAVGPGDRDRDGKLIRVSLSEGDTVLLSEYGGTEVKLRKSMLTYACHFDLALYSLSPSFSVAVALYT